MEKRYQIFISSTYKDLIEERQAVTQAILKMYHFPIGMEMFHADNEEQWVQIKNTIDMSDYYILIMGRYCGTLIDTENISYTEKEYNYALSKGIPVLSFVIDDKAKKESYGVETVKHQKAYTRFKKKVLKLPCDFWINKDDLALKVTTALSMKFKENNRNGWVPYNFTNIISRKSLDSNVVGEYFILYYSVFKSTTRRLILSKLAIDHLGNVTFYNNYNEISGTSEYLYHGVCNTGENNLYIHLKNDYSNEYALMTLIKSVGNLKRYIGIFTALSSNAIPVSLKIACFDSQFYRNGINYPLLENLLTTPNSTFNEQVLIIEEQEKYSFFSDQIKASK